MLWVLDTNIVDPGFYGMTHRHVCWTQHKKTKWHFLNMASKLKRQPWEPFVVSLSNHERLPERLFTLRQAGRTAVYTTLLMALCIKTYQDIRIVTATEALLLITAK